MTTQPPAADPSATPERAPGEIITFYSYKGGTGRSMALANVGCLLAERARAEGRGVLLVDWDLEAPGLHRYFYDSFSDLARVRPDAPPGLIDLFRRLDEATPAEGYKDEFEGAAHAEQLAEKFSVREYALPLKVPNLYLLKAGRFDDDYSRLVNTFDWEGLHRRSPWLIRALADRWAEEFSYVLIDSRTGLTDTSGICTTLLPEKLVVVFTPNRQSFTGVANLVRRATRYRKESEDLRPLVVFPLPSRIEASLSDLRNHWRFGNPEREIVGYQPMFEELFREVYRLGPGECDLSRYFEEVQIQQTPDYAYGEEIAVLAEKQRDRFSLTRSFETFTQRLLNDEGPWARDPAPATTTAPADDPKARILASAAALFARMTPDEQQRALRLLARLVTVAPTGEGSRDTLAPGKFIDIDAASRPAFKALVNSDLIRSRLAQEGDTQEITVELADEALVRDWEPLRAWINEHRDFLLWRQKLKTYLEDWERGGRTSHDLLSGSTLSTARRYAEAKPDDLNVAEILYIAQSVRRRWLQTAARVVGIIALLSILGFVGWLFSKAQLDVPSNQNNQNLAYPANQSGAYPGPSPAAAEVSLDEWKKTGTVYVFYATDKEAVAARALAYGLTASGYKVADPLPGLIQADYMVLVAYDDQDRVAGSDVARITRSFFATPAWGRPAGFAYIAPKQPRGAAGGLVEVWLPSLSGAGATPSPVNQTR
jgi:cellulose biosynthesis protein BcsQ